MKKNEMEYDRYLYDNQMKRTFGSISIGPNKKLDAMFSYPIDSLKNIFDNDDNMITLISLDFSEFDWSKITSTDN